MWYQIWYQISDIRYDIRYDIRSDIRSGIRSDIGPAIGSNIIRCIRYQLQCQLWYQIWYQIVCLSDPISDLIQFRYSTSDLMQFRYQILYQIWYHETKCQLNKTRLHFGCWPGSSSRHRSGASELCTKLNASATKPANFILGNSLASYLFERVLKRQEASDHPRVKLVAGRDPVHDADLVLPSLERILFLGNH